MKQDRIKPLTIASIAAAFLSTGLSSGTHAEPGAKVVHSEPAILQLLHAPSPRFAGYYATHERGFYRREGLLSTRERSQQGPAAPGVLNGVLNGQAPYSVAGAEFPLLRMQGEPLLAPLVASWVALENFINRSGAESGNTGLRWLLVGLICLSLTAAFGVVLLLVFNQRLHKSVRQRAEQLSTLNAQLRQQVVEREKAAKAYRECEERFRNLIEGSVQGIVIQRGRNTLFVNQAYADILKYDSPQEILALDSYDTQVASYDRERLRRYGRLRMEGGRAPVQYEYDALTKDGSTVTLHAAVRLINWDGEPAFQSMVLDVTEKKLAEEALRRAYDLEDKVLHRTRELQEANAKLAELDRLKSMFIASMSHELRTPLNAIIGITGLMLQGIVGELNDRQRDQLQRVYGASKHLLALITDVIDISRIEAGKMELEPDHVCIADVVAMAVDSVRAEAEQKGLSLGWYCSSELTVHTDQKRLLQCIINLLGNAVKFTERGEVSVVAGLRNGMVEIRVCDSGIGIAPEALPRLFEPFERIDSHLRIRTLGTGLGLYLTKKIAGDLLGGSVDFHSELGKGSEFIIALPHTRAATAEGSELDEVKDASASDPTPVKTSPIPSERLLRDGVE
jgi:PAS domain S-box-containing protein